MYGPAQSGPPKEMGCSRSLKSHPTPKYSLCRRPEKMAPFAGTLNRNQEEDQEEEEEEGEESWTQCGPGPVPMLKLIVFVSFTAHPTPLQQRALPPTCMTQRRLAGTKLDLGLSLLLRSPKKLALAPSVGGCRGYLGRNPIIHSVNLLNTYCIIDIKLGDRDTTKKHDRLSLLSSWSPEFKTRVLNTFYATDLFSDNGEANRPFLRKQNLLNTKNKISLVTKLTNYIEI